MKKFLTIFISFSLISLNAGFFNDKGTFDDLYPTPFYKTTAGQWAIIGATAVVSTGTIIATGGVAAVPLSTTIGGFLGSTWTAGLAALGGGTLAAGGFGMAGGAMVIGVVTDLGLAGLTEFIPSNNYNGSYNYLKIHLPEKGSDAVLNVYEQMEELKEKFEDGEIDKIKYGKQLRKYYGIALDSVDLDGKKAGYDFINKAILEFNLGRFEDSKESINKAENYFENKSYINYHKALLFLAEENNTEEAIKKLKSSINYEKNVLKPYLLLSTIYKDEGKYDNAMIWTNLGLKNFDDESFELNFLAGELNYKLKNYSEAKEYFREALSNITTNELEAECKVMIALSLHYMNEKDEAEEWYEKALAEVEDNKQYTEKISSMWHDL